jgi:hypothetical protein
MSAFENKEPPTVSAPESKEPPGTPTKFAEGAKFRALANTLSKDGNLTEELFCKLLTSGHKNLDAQLFTTQYKPRFPMSISLAENLVVSEVKKDSGVQTKLSAWSCLL